jgi:hypothetical protein
MQKFARYEIKKGRRSVVDHWVVVRIGLVAGCWLLVLWLHDSGGFSEGDLREPERYALWCSMGSCMVLQDWRAKGEKKAKSKLLCGRRGKALSGIEARTTCISIVFFFAHNFIGTPCT